MKKYLNLLFLSLLIFTGCGKKETSIEVLENVLKNDETVKSVMVEMKADISVEEEGVKVDLPLSAMLKVDMQSEKEGKLEILVNENPFIGENKLYLELLNNEMIFYLPSGLISTMAGVDDENPTWIVQKEEINLEEEEIDLNAYNEKVNELLGVITEEDFVFISKEGDISHYEFRITDDLIKRLAEKFEMEVEEELKTTLTIDMYIDTKNDQLTKIEVDLKEMLSKLPLEDDMDLDMIKTLSISVDVKDYNKTNVEIPNDVKNNSVTLEEYQNSLYDNTIEE